jgi:acetolactate synthase-1/2/3 large subunit
MNKTVADSIIEILRDEGIEVVFSLIATSIMDLFDALAREPAIRVVVSQHEQGAAFMSDGFARVSQRPAVCIVSAGPGATNVITGVAQAYHESSPVVLLSSESSTHIHGRGRGNFHEVDQLSLFRPITKWAVRAEQAQRIPELPGPVYVGLPKDFLLQPATGSRPGVPGTEQGYRTSGQSADLDKAVELLSEAEHPFILAGGGVIWSGARKQLREVAERLVAPVASTPWHRGILSDAHPLGVGQLGNSGTQPALQAAARSDVMLVVGATMSELTTDRYSQRIIRPATQLVQIDIDPQEVGKNYPVAVGLVGDAGAVLEALSERLDASGKGGGADQPAWQKHPRLQAIQNEKEAWTTWLAGLRQANESAPIGRLTVLHALRQLVDDEAIIVAESGGTAAFTRFALPAYEPQILPGDFSAMGSGFCMALGAKVAFPERQVISLTGDGSFMMVLQELQTAVDHRINTVTVIFHNDSYANMKYKLAELFDGRYLGVDFDYPNFAEIARQFGAWGERIESTAELRPGIEKALASERPAVLDVMVDPADQVPPSDIYRKWIKERQMEPAG